MKPMEAAINNETETVSLSTLADVDQQDRARAFEIARSLARGEVVSRADHIFARGLLGKEALDAEIAVEKIRIAARARLEEQRPKLAAAQEEASRAKVKGILLDSALISAKQRVTDLEGEIREAFLVNHRHARRIADLQSQIQQAELEAA
jgi:hypothetical protein